MHLRASSRALNSRLSRLELLGNVSVRHLLLRRLHNGPGWPENLQLIVLGRGEHEPRVIPVPAEVGDAVGEASVDEEQLWRAVFSLLWSLFFSNFADIPEVNALVHAGASKDCAVRWVPVNVDDRLSVVLEAMKLLVQKSQIPQTHGVIG